MAPEKAMQSDVRFDQRQFRRWLDDRPAYDLNHYELIEGRIAMTPPAGWPHGRVAARITSRLERHVHKHGLGVVLDSSTGYELPSGDTVEPDVSFISAQSFARGPRPVAGQFLRIVPNLVVEILSPSTARRDRTEKKKLYQANGVEEYWIVDSARASVTVFHLGKRGYGGRSVSEGKVRSRVVPDFQMQIEEIFSD